jgi:hypothetical protein
MTTLDEGTADTGSMDAAHLHCHGRHAYAGALAQELETRGLSVAYQPPVETKDFAEAMSALSPWSSRSPVP